MSYRATHCLRPVERANLNVGNPVPRKQPKILWVQICHNDSAGVPGRDRNLCVKAGVQKEGAFHRLRHTFATNYVRSGGNVLYLSRVLGHSTLHMTKRYVGVEIEALREMQIKTSLMSRLR
ncbi:MAG: tyrosine-type recombinase/integrase [Acidobacteriota bacterium]|nr:tyrosine-type recombinase/integrase [Acidobacteriota bacterium]